jgi:poly(A) polymerase
MPIHRTMARTDIGSAAWLNWPGTRTVMASLDAARPGGARFVGGCVRNELRNVPVDDIDIATQLKPDETIAALQAAGIRAIPTGLEHGTITAICEGSPFEITSLRRDVETDGRRAVVAFTEDWGEDAERRDFRLNAIYASADGALHEIVPGSVADAIDGRVIFIGDAEQRLREDYLRILRFFRFNAWYGAGMDSEGLAACERQKDGLAKIAAERIWKELKRLMEAPDPSEAMMAMDESGILEAVLPGANASELPSLVSVEQGADLAPNPLQRLMAMVPRRARDVTSVTAHLRLSNAEADRLAEWADPALTHVLGVQPDALRRLFYQFGPRAVLDRALIEAAQVSEADALAAIKAAAAGWQKPDFPLGGADALAAGLRGPDVGAVLRALEQSWVASDFSLTRDELVARLNS